jgi:drug/metabolite transporter (DMT)-like permease
MAARGTQTIRLSTIALVGGLVLVWGCNWPAMKIVLAYVTPLWFAVLRMAMGTLSLFLVTVVWVGRVKLPDRADLPVVLSVGLLQMAGFLALVNLALMNVPAGRSAILAYTTPLWVLPGAIFILGERLSRAKSLALLLGLAGVAFMFNPAGFDWSDSKALAGNAYLLVGAALWAVAIIHVRKHRWVGSPLTLAPWQMLTGLVPLTILAWQIEGPPPPVSHPASAIALALYSGPLVTAFPFWAAVTAARILPAVTVSLTLLLVPVIGLLSSALVLHERLSATTVTGLLLIVSGIAAVNFANARESKVPGKANA